MKKIYLAFFTLVTGLSLNAQLTNANHSPVAGEVFSTYQCDSTAISVGASGASALWNYATIPTHSSVVNNYTANANSNVSYPVPGVAVGSVLSNLSYYQSSNSALNYFGGNIQIATVSAALIYTSSAVVAVYPMSLNTASTSATGGTFNITSPFPQAGTFTGNSETVADATGTLVIPTGTFTNVIRVVTSQTINFNATITGTVTQKNYDYYNAGTKEALFTISTSTVDIPSFPPASTRTIVTRTKPVTVGIKENKQALIELSFYPNPSSTIVNFITESAEAKQILVYDITGKLVEKQNFTDG
ncbi:MAG: T9SS type A sorting domain-containing protein, partial [Bacteroidota bacterium]